MDNGPHHFRTLELVQYYFQLQKQLQLTLFRWHFFTEYHGKSIVDTHFSKITAAVRTYSLTPNQTITDTESLVHAIRTQFRSWQEIDKVKAPKLTNSSPLEEHASFYDVSIQSLPVPIHPLECVKRKVPNFKTFFSFENQKGFLHAGAYTNHTRFVQTQIITTPYTSKQTQQQDTPLSKIPKITAHKEKLASSRLYIEEEEQEGEEDIQQTITIQSQQSYKRKHTQMLDTNTHTTSSITTLSQPSKRQKVPSVSRKKKALNNKPQIQHYH